MLQLHLPPERANPHWLCKKPSFLKESFANEFIHPKWKQSAELGTIFYLSLEPTSKNTIAPKANTFHQGYQQMKKQTLLAWMRLLLEKRLQDWTPMEWKLSRRQGWQDVLCNSSVSTTCWMACLHLTLAFLWNDPYVSGTKIGLFWMVKAVVP